MAWPASWAAMTTAVRDRPLQVLAEWPLMDRGVCSPRPSQHGQLHLIEDMTQIATVPGSPCAWLRGPHGPCAPHSCSIRAENQRQNDRTDVDTPQLPVLFPPIVKNNRDRGMAGASSISLLKYVDDHRSSLAYCCCSVSTSPSSRKSALRAQAQLDRAEQLVANLRFDVVLCVFQDAALASWRPHAICSYLWGRKAAAPNRGRAHCRIQKNSCRSRCTEQDG